MGTVSCIIPSANRPSQLRTAIESVLEQTYDDVELLVVYEPDDEATAVVVDDYSNDDTVVAGIASADGSPMKARNTGIDHASGEYVAFLDDDDAWDPERLEVALPHTTEYSLVTCLPRIVRPNGVMVQPHEFSGRKILDIDDVFDAVRYFPASNSIGIEYLIPSCTLTKLEYVRSIEGFRPHHHEWDFYLRLVSKFGPAVVLERPLVDFDRTDSDRYSDQDDVHSRLETTFEAQKGLVDRPVRKRVLSELSFARYRLSDGNMEKMSALARALYHDRSRLTDRGRR